MAGRFPGARDLAEFWRNLRDGIESISFFSKEEITEEAPETLADPYYVAARGVLEEAEMFDAELFGYSPLEAEIIDPQQRVFLEIAWAALEDAGYDTSRGSHLVGIYAGVSASTYSFNFFLDSELRKRVGAMQLWVANEKDFLCTRAAYKLGLEGPSVVVQTACSTSLVAVHLACQALLAGECAMTLAGGVSIAFPQRIGYVYQENGVVSPDGHCRTFDARAQGTVNGSGVGIVVLKRLADALKDGDSIRAVIKGSAINNDGSFRAGYTAPRQEGQAKAIRAAHLAAEVEPDTIGYLEAHGTATELGDPIELSAAAQAFRAGTDRKGFCAVGSVKTNVGHLDAAAGIAGLIKTVLALEHEMLPPSLHFERPNPKIDFANSPFYVQTELAPWPAGEHPRRAGVSSFGLGGANAHVVLEERPPVLPSAPGKAWQLIPLSARTPSALERMTSALAVHLHANPDLPLADVSYVCQVGRRELEHRRVVVCHSLAGAACDLEARSAGRVLTSSSRRAAPPVAFLFSGLGDHYPDMGLGLYRTEPVFRAEVDRSAQLLKSELGVDLRELLYPDRLEDAVRPPVGAGLDLRGMLRSASVPLDEAGWQLHQTAILQPVLFVLEYALARLWRSFGIEPEAMLGYSLGEYTAACVAGVLSFEEALVLVTRRALMIDRLPPGAMLAVPLSEGEIGPYLTGRLSLSAVNGPDLVVVAGGPEEVEELEHRLKGRGLPCRRLQTAHAFHSALMEPIAGPFRDLVASFDLRPPKIPYISNVTGTWITAAEATDPAYWVRHLCEPVRFIDGVGELWREERILLEVGPGQSLGSLALQQSVRAPGAEPLVLSSIRNLHERQEDEEFLLKSLGSLWLAGVEVDWAAGVHSGERRRRVALPTYPFERRRCWIEGGKPAATVTRTEEVAPVGALDKRLDPADWFYAPSFRRSVRPLTVRRSLAGERYLLLRDESLGPLLEERLAAAGCEVVSVTPGDGFRRTGERAYTLRPGDSADYASLFAALGGPPARIVHLWSLGPLRQPAKRALLEEELAEEQERGFFSLLALARALPSGPVEITMIADRVLAVESGESPLPERATLLGPLRVIPQEYPSIACRLIDVDLEELGSGLPERLLVELGEAASDPLVARRQAYRWVPSFEPVRLAAGSGLPERLREGGVYLVTGGFGGIGFALAEFLASRFQAKLILMGRSAVPERADWDRYATHDRWSDLIGRLRGLERVGAEVLALSADVTDRERMTKVIEQASDRFGRIDGVFHVAAVPGGGLIQVKDRDSASHVLATKAWGTLVLTDLLRGAPPDFLVLFSSIAAHVGGVGQVDYCAANAFLDACAWQLDAPGGPAIVTIDWCEWQWDGWTQAALPVHPWIKERLDSDRRAYGLTFDEGMEALRRILASNLPQVVVSTRDLASTLGHRYSITEVLAGLAEFRQNAGTAHRRPALGTPYRPPGNGLERALVGIWQELLGVEPVGIDDHFFQLGGHSLLGLQVAARAREVLGLDLPLNLLFENPTVSGLADQLGAAGEPEELAVEIRSADSWDAEEMLNNLDQLSEKEMDALLSDIQAEPDRESA